MYLSHPVRRMREDPRPGEEVELIVTAAEPAEGEPGQGETGQGETGDRESGADKSGEGGAIDRLATALEAAGATVEERLRFGALRVTVDQAKLDDVCALEGIESIETGATRELTGGDAGEDV